MVIIGIQLHNSMITIVINRSINTVGTRFTNIRSYEQNFSKKKNSV